MAPERQEYNRPSSLPPLLKNLTPRIDVRRKAVVLLLCDVFLLALCPRASIKLHGKGQMTLMVF